MKKLINTVIVGVVGLLIISLHYSCTTYEAPDGIAEDGFDSDSVISTTIHRKVLWINIDGFVFITDFCCRLLIIASHFEQR